MANTWTVVMYPEGVIVGKVTTGKNTSGKVRHVAKDADGDRIGTFDSFKDAKAALEEAFRSAR
jgi:hypothetical protein